MIVSSWTFFVYLPHIDQAVSVIGSMHTLPSSMVPEGDASFWLDIFDLLALCHLGGQCGW